MELLEIFHFIWAEGRGMEREWVVVEETRGLGKNSHIWLEGCLAG